MPDIHFKTHNHLVVPVPVTYALELPYRPRGGVSMFSKFSQRRLIQLFYSFEQMPFKSFWTLTFEKDVKVPFAKKELHRLTMVLNRRGIGWLWVMEFTENRRIHFHMCLTKCISSKFISARWRNGFVKATKIFSDGIRNYIFKEVSKNNQKGFTGFNGRWWGVSRSMNHHGSMGIHDESFLRALVDIRGFKRNYYLRDLENIVDLPNS